MFTQGTSIFGYTHPKNLAPGASLKYTLKTSCKSNFTLANKATGNIESKDVDENGNPIIWLVEQKVRLVRNSNITFDITNDVLTRTMFTINGHLIDEQRLTTLINID